VGKPRTQYSAPTATAFSVTVISGSDIHLILTPTGAFAAGTIVLPASPSDKQTLLVNCTQDITTLTITSDHTVVGAPTAITANDYFTLKYDITFETWCRVA
jgi:acyl-CoA synthetase (AMP-forming)/AMP-acid ligase II